MESFKATGMRIALLTDGMHPWVIGGMQRHSYYLAKYMAKAGVDVDVYHIRVKDHKYDYTEHFTPEELTHLNFKEIDFPVPGNGIGHYIRESYEYSRRILKQMGDPMKYDFIYCKGFTGWELLNKKQSGMKFPPVGVNMHGYEMFQKPASWKEWLSQKLVLQAPSRYQISKADYVFSYGGKVTDILVSAGVQRNRIIEIPGGISSEWLVPQVKRTEQVRKFVFVGRNERRKGLKELNEVLKVIPGGNWEMNIIGVVPSTMKVSKPGVTYHGEIRDTSKLKELISLSDVMVCPSLSEGMPNVILEGMASGLAIIATDTGATELMVDSANGWLIHAGNVTELESVFRNALECSATDLDSKKRSSLIKVTEKFTWDRIIAVTLDEIRKRTT